jgi:hypothetical protein
MNNSKVPENRAYKVTLILLLGLAAFSTAMKDLNRLQELVSSAQELTDQWRGADLIAVNDKAMSTVEGSCPNDASLLANSSAESNSSDSVAAGTAIEIERIDRENIAEPAVGGNVEVVALRKANRSVSRLARPKSSRAKTLKGETFAKSRRGSWPERFEFKTVDRHVTLDIPVRVFTDIKAAGLDAERSSDFPLSLLGRTSRKLSSGRTSNGRRELIL